METTGSTNGQDGNGIEREQTGPGAGAPAPTNEAELGLPPSGGEQNEAELGLPPRNEEKEDPGHSLYRERKSSAADITTEDDEEMKADTEDKEEEPFDIC